MQPLPIFDHAKHNKTVIFKLKRLLFKLFNILGVSLCASVMGCSDFFFLKKCFMPILMTTFHGYYETKLCQTELTFIIRYQIIARALFRVFFFSFATFKTYKR